MNESACYLSILLNSSGRAAGRLAAVVATLVLALALG